MIFSEPVWTSKEQEDDDVRKTIEAFDDLGAKDAEG
jgi:hypothetical protein